MNKNLSALIFSTAFAFLSTAQTPAEPSKIKVYTGSTNVETKESNSYNWTIKTDLLAAVVGELPIIVEYRIARKFSVEASAGITYAILPNSLFFDDEDDFFDTKAALGSAFRAGIKYYPSSDYDAIEGWGFGIQIFTKTNNREYGGDNIALEGKKDSKVKTGAAITISRQIFRDSNISLEWLMGFGLANSERTHFVEEYNDVTQNSEVIEKQTTKSAPSIQLGFRIGFGN